MLFLRITLLFVLSIAVALVVDLSIRPQDRFDWLLLPMSLLMPAALAGAASFLLACAARRVRNRFT